MRVVLGLFRHDAAVGIIWSVAAVPKPTLDNSPLAYSFDQLLTTPAS